MEEIKKIRSRDAARQRRGQQNDEFGELSQSLPLPASITEKLDRLCVMRLTTSYIKNKHILHQIKDAAPRSLSAPKIWDSAFTHCIEEALGGFVFVLSEDGQCLYISPNVNENLGLQQLDVTGQSFYKYVHPCDQENLAKQLGGQVPLEDMEIFDGFFCSDSSQFVKNPKAAVSTEFSNSPHRSFFLRMKSTLTSRGKSVNINASIYRAVHCSGTIQMYRTKLGMSDTSLTRCMIGVGLPLMSRAVFEVPADRETFITKHSLDMVTTDIEGISTEILGYDTDAIEGKSWYLFCHICDNEVLKACHTTVLKIGQAVSGYYRVMLNNGGWIWMQTKANMVYVGSTGQPQHILCIHYVISGLELEDELLSEQQMESPSSKSFLKRAAFRQQREKAEDSPVTKSPKSCDSPINVDVKPQVELPFVPDLNSSDEFDDLPGLEFLDVTDGYPDEDFCSRSPFIPTPFSDIPVKDGVEEDLISLCDEREIMNRAPYIPPPCIDALLSFDDIPLPDINTDGSPLVELRQTPNSIPSELYDFGNARIPYHLLPNNNSNAQQQCKKATATM